MSTTDESEWIDITNEVILETSLETGEGKIILPKWPGKENLRVMRKKEVKKDVGRLAEVGDEVAYSVDGTLGTGVFLRYDCGTPRLKVTCPFGGKVFVHPFDVLEVWRDGVQIYKA